ncbi:hypothetical protein DFA_02981 [Cavenderia fasciculata]|uniref:Uncharacterized protein n=1 Tax=Cavenderia fasciculata TaxID=261658 RepID=F4PGA3_CACFS|nr:uncharacterized protein DFA_02981 [Cavenderia fasciculata]EGG24737.1 hypothetical protein DFA_02981 [Cavenderia fasciculata]|eukprot:XP_004362588.1 hypothetical protein DFA_02981 [Cavenderia fasciculata]
MALSMSVFSVSYSTYPFAKPRVASTSFAKIELYTRVIQIMAVDTMTVRNACPFPVVFYAIAGPKFVLKPLETQSAKACAIWFSTRVLSQFSEMNENKFKDMKDDYTTDLKNGGYKPDDWEGGGSGATAGSLLGVLVGDLTEVFQVTNTIDTSNNTCYYGAKREGVYGHCNLVITATPDPAHPAWWRLKIEKEQGQTVPDFKDFLDNNLPPAYVYSVPNLDAYKSTYFVRMRNKSSGFYLSAPNDVTDMGAPHMIGPGSPYSPLEVRQYFTARPLGTSGGYDINLLNIAKNSDGSVTNRVLYSRNEDNGLGFASDVDDQSSARVWTIKQIQQNPTVINLLRGVNYKALSLVPGGVGVNLVDGQDDQNWEVETFTCDIQNYPSDKGFNLVFCQSGYPLGTNMYSQPIIIQRHDDIQNWYLEPVDDARTQFRIKNAQNFYLTYVEDNNTLTVSTAKDGVHEVFSFKTIDHYAGFIITNTRASQNHGWDNGSFRQVRLCYSGGSFGFHNDISQPDSNALWISYF